MTIEDICCDAGHHLQGQVDIDLYGCPCCAPGLHDLGLMSFPAMASAASSGAWKRLGPPPEAQSGTILFSNATVMTVD